MRFRPALLPATAALLALSLHSGALAQAPETGPRVKVNQLGYLPNGPKMATFMSNHPTPLLWRLVDGNGKELARGKTVPRGHDSSVGRKVHTIDFSQTAAKGEAFTLVVDGETSHPFAIASDLYTGLPRDAFGYFYPVRSGVEIKADIAGAAYARPAGHISAPEEDAANKGDRNIPCQSAETARSIYGEAWSCDYTLDVSGGWYDAGDHGKYVVNGGISAAQLMGAYERALHLPGASMATMADSVLAIPEAGNGVPDALDEARWELEFMRAMQVPEGKPYAGMAHHKVHDEGWTGLPTLPHEDPKRRELHRPSTAATLNLAAAAAQGARLFKPFDADFSRQLLAASQKAWQAAQVEPELYAPAADTNGGGPYDDTDVSDEFFWAAAELFITTGDKPYRQALEASPHWQAPLFRRDGFDWANLAPLATLSLTLAPNALPDEDIAVLRASIVEAADAYLTLQKDQPFGHFYAPEDGKYGWASNYLNVQNAIIVSRAYDLTGDKKYRDGVLEAADYLFGRNGPGISYVTGYGTYFAKNQHSRWFANQLEPALPNPPKGALAGGPNSWAGDTIAQEKLDGCAPQFCYIDHIESWGTNEIAINWNAALAQLSAFLAEQ